MAGITTGLGFKGERERERKGMREGHKKTRRECSGGIIVLLVVDELYLPIEGLCETVDEVL